LVCTWGWPAPSDLARVRAGKRTPPPIPRATFIRGSLEKGPAGIQPSKVLRSA
jgi:hypothetical protein